MNPDSYYTLEKNIPKMYSIYNVMTAITIY